MERPGDTLTMPSFTPKISFPYTFLTSTARPQMRDGQKLIICRLLRNLTRGRWSQPTPTATRSAHTLLNGSQLPLMVSLNQDFHLKPTSSQRPKGAASKESINNLDNPYWAPETLLTPDTTTSGQIPSKFHPNSCFPVYRISTQHSLTDLSIFCTKICIMFSYWSPKHLVKMSINHLHDTLVYLWRIPSQVLPHFIPKHPNSNCTNIHKPIHVITKLNIQLTTKPLTLPTRIGSGPENSSSTNIWFQTHPLLARWRTRRPSGLEVSLSELGLISKLRDWLSNGTEEPKHTQVIHASMIRVHTSLCISALPFSIFTVQLF